MRRADSAKKWARSRHSATLASTSFKYASCTPAAAQKREAEIVVYFHHASLPFAEDVRLI
jgi:hypothetical protein